MKSKEQEYIEEIHSILLGHGIRDNSRRESIIKCICNTNELFESKIDRSKPLPYEKPKG